MSRAQKWAIWTASAVGMICTGIVFESLTGIDADIMIGWWAALIYTHLRPFAKEQPHDP